MKFIETILDRHRERFEKGGNLAKWKPLFEAADTIMLWTNERTKASPHVRDPLDLKPSHSHARAKTGGRRCPE